MMLDERLSSALVDELTQRLRSRARWRRREREMFVLLIDWLGSFASREVRAGERRGFMFGAQHT